jgi:hypothetical protein
MLFAFKLSMIHGILQFTWNNTLYCVLNRPRPSLSIITRALRTDGKIGPESCSIIPCWRIRAWTCPLWTLWFIRGKRVGAPREPRTRGEREEGREKKKKEGRSPPLFFSPSPPLFPREGDALPSGPARNPPPREGTPLAGTDPDRGRPPNPSGGREYPRLSQERGRAADRRERADRCSPPKGRTGAARRAPSPSSREGRRRGGWFRPFRSSTTSWRVSKSRCGRTYILRPYCS